MIYHDPMLASAVLSPDRTLRFSLRRIWRSRSPIEPQRVFHVVGVNPSTADETKNDRTVNRLIEFGQRSDCDELMLYNLHPLRSKNPAPIIKIPRDPSNQTFLRDMLKRARVSDGDIVLCAWGAVVVARPWAAEFIAEAAKIGTKLYCLGRAKGGEPRHPLYVPGSQLLEPFP